MELAGFLKKKYEKIVRRKLDELKGRKQLNMTVDCRLIDEVKRIAAEFSVPRYVIVEHGLQIACFYLDKILRNPGKQEAVHGHLINGHLLVSEVCDDEAILRIGEGRYASELLSLAKCAVQSCKSFKHAVSVFQKTGDIDPVKKAEKQFQRSALVLVNWLDTHPLDEAENEETEIK